MEIFVSSRTVSYHQMINYILRYASNIICNKLSSPQLIPMIRLEFCQCGGKPFALLHGKDDASSSGQLTQLNKSFDKQIKQLSKTPVSLETIPDGSGIKQW